MFPDLSLYNFRVDPPDIHPVTQPSQGHNLAPPYLLASSHLDLPNREIGTLEERIAQTICQSRNVTPVQIEDQG